MKCYYEVLGVPRDVNDDELKKAYKKLALKWHPDKNVDNAEVAKETFQLVQQAYEVLIDPHERAWYDNHREAILKGGLGGDYKDDSFDILPYFSASCYKGFGDDPNGFYAIYAEVFKKLAAEDSEYMKEDDPEIPTFGKSDSPYEEEVAPFYSYWMYYSTKKSYYWLDPHDTRQAPNHKIAKLIEKENKKVRDKAKKERNEEVRNLVAFVRKRDKRVQAWNKYLEEKAKENQKKTEKIRLQKLNERRKQMVDYKESDWLKFSNVENDLKQIEMNLAKEFGDDEPNSEVEDPENVPDNDSFFCVACNKVFKTEKSFANHEKSKKHKENVAQLKETIIEENDTLNLVSSDKTIDPLIKTSNNEDIDGVNNSEIIEEKKVKKKMKQKKIQKSFFLEDNSCSEDSNEPLDQILSSQGRKSRNRNVAKEEENGDDDEEEEDIVERKGKKKNKSKQSKNPDKNPSKTNTDCDNLENELDDLTISNSINDEKPEILKQRKKNKKTDSIKTKELNIDLVCAVCNNEFPSKNKLFNHLKSTGHSVYLPNSSTALKKQEKQSSQRKK